MLKSLVGLFDKLAGFFTKTEAEKEAKRIEERELTKKEKSFAIGSAIKNARKGFTDAIERLFNGK